MATNQNTEATRSEEKSTSRKCARPACQRRVRRGWTCRTCDRSGFCPHCCSNKTEDGKCTCVSCLTGQSTNRRKSDDELAAEQADRDALVDDIGGAGSFDPSHPNYGPAQS